MHIQADMFHSVISPTIIGDWIHLKYEAVIIIKKNLTTIRKNAKEQSIIPLLTRTTILKTHGNSKPLTLLRFFLNMVKKVSHW